MDYTGTGNTLNVMHARVLQLIMDSLRYWVTEMHVDGFRFDLAATLARELHAVSKLSAFFDIIHQDPVLSQVKLIAEPWDVGEGGYQVGNFPVLWAEWNGKYRDTVRGLLEGRRRPHRRHGLPPQRQPDLYQWNGKRPYASINFITATTASRWPTWSVTTTSTTRPTARTTRTATITTSPGTAAPKAHRRRGINKLRRRQQRNFLATLFLSQGVPMLCGGDECGRTQQGNNNAYCQDNEISWTLPPPHKGSSWDALVDTSCEPAGRPRCRPETEGVYTLEGRSMVVLEARAARRPRTVAREFSSYETSNQEAPRQEISGHRSAGR
jgi:isoamylase